MILASDVKTGTALRIDEKLYKTIEVIRHSGTAKMSGFIELKLRDLQTGHIVDRRFKNEDKLDDVELTKKQMEYIYSDDTACYFMDPKTFEQVPVSKESIGDYEVFLTEGMKIPVELLGEQAVTIDFPKIVELKVASTGPGIKDTESSTMKPATLENDTEILVPQFIETGDTVRVDTEKKKYVDRVMPKKA